MKLFAKVSDPWLLLKSLNEAGTAFYRMVEKGLVEALYFSTSRTIYFMGELSKEQMKTLRAFAVEVERFRIDEFNGVIEVSQLEA